MKQFLACVAFLAASAWSAIGLQWTKLNFDNGSLNIDTTKTIDVDTSYVNIMPNQGFAYYSTLDTNYVVFSEPRQARIRVYCQIPPELLYTSFEFPHGMAEVLRYEFMKWQEWGLIDITRDSAQKLIERIVPESKKVSGYSIFYSKECEADPSTCYFSLGAVGGGSIPAEDAMYLPQKKILLNAETVNPGTTSLSRESSKAILGVGNVLQGTGFKAFDMNGIYLYRGTWQGESTFQGRMVILKFENGKTAVFH
jgi:hypothetical protein